MSKVAHYLQEHLAGEVFTSTNLRRYFSTDASILSITPSTIIYPQNENDVRKTTRFSWQLAERGRNLPITARGLGTNCAGSAIGSGIIMAFPGHMNRILEFDGKTGTVIVEPGINFASLQQTLHTHGRFIPVSPPLAHLSTVGGVIATGTSGQTAIKYGGIERYVKALRVVLANGEVIETRKLSKREVSKKLGQANFEGEVYRSLDKLLEENFGLLAKVEKAVSKNTAGYNITKVKHKDGSIDLTPLFMASEGTLGLITEATLKTELHNPATTMIVAYLDDIKLADAVLAELRSLADRPCSAQLIDQQLLELVHKYNPNQLKGIIDKPLPKLVLIIEFDNLSARIQKRLVKKVQKALRHEQVNFLVASTEEEKERLRKIQQAVATLSGQSEGGNAILPFVDDGIVPVDRFIDFLEAIYELTAKYHLQAGLRGDILSANLQLMPMLDLSAVGDRQKIFRLMDDYYKVVAELGGSASGESGDGRVRAPYLSQIYGEDGYGLMKKVKQAFDPYNILNPGVKVDMTLEGLKPLLRNNYTVDHLYSYLPMI